MSEMVRCDKCKAELPKTVAKRGGVINILKGKREEPYYCFTIRDMMYSYGNGMKFHLCKDCTESLKKWFDEEIER